MKTIEVFDAPELDGGGRVLAPHFERLIPAATYKTIMEWCAGPAYIGFRLIQTNRCERLVLVETNERACDFAATTARRAGIEDRVDIHCGSIAGYRGPPVDLVVANPPNYYDIQASHPAYEAMKDDPRPNDRDWLIHAEFYDRISDHLLPGGRLMISEVEIFSRIVEFGGEVYDRRSEIPVISFGHMIDAAGLEIFDITEYAVCDGARLHMLTSGRP